MSLGGEEAVPVSACNPNEMSELSYLKKKIVEERATHTHLHVNSNSNIGNNCNIGENKNDTIFGSKFSNITINISEYGDKMKKYYDATHC